MATVKELRARAKGMKLRNYSKLKKADLIRLIEANTPNDPPAYRPTPKPRRRRPVAAPRTGRAAVSYVLPSYESIRDDAPPNYYGVVENVVIETEYLFPDFDFPKRELGPRFTKLKSQNPEIVAKFKPFSMLLKLDYVLAHYLYPRVKSRIWRLHGIRLPGWQLFFIIQQTIRELFVSRKVNRIALSEKIRKLEVATLAVNIDIVKKRIRQDKIWDKPEAERLLNILFKETKYRNGPRSRLQTFI